MRIVEINPAIKELVDANDGFCPCAIEKTPDTVLPLQGVSGANRTRPVPLWAV